MIATLAIAVAAVGTLFLLAWFFAPVSLSFASSTKSVRDWLCVDDANQVKSSLLASKASYYVSVVIPAYNEEERILSMLNEAFEYFDARTAQDKAFTYELIVVDDCSTDKTIAVVKEQIKLHGNDKLKLLRLKKNHGKGGAVRTGVLMAQGEVILMADADGATKMADFAKLEDVLKKEASAAVSGVVVCGSRAHLEGEAIAKRHPLRNFLMFGFHWIVSMLCVNSIHDTQCGFKLFDRRAAQLLFPPQHIERWGFDVELLYIAYKRKIPCKEVAVRWTEIPGSKLDVVEATLSMLREMILIPLCYNLGIWSIEDGAFRLNSSSSE